VTNPYALELAKTRGAELRREASAARLAAIATCCRPSTWARAIHRAIDAASRLHLRDHRKVSSAC
jgi:hypothetical protein